MCHPSAVLRQAPLCKMKCAVNGTKCVGNGSDDTLLMKGNRRDHVHLLAMSQRSVRNDGPSLKASRTNFAFSLRAQAPVSSDRSARALASKRILSSRVPCNRFLDARVVAGQFPESRLKWNWSFEFSKTWKLVNWNNFQRQMSTHGRFNET